MLLNESFLSRSVLGMVIPIELYGIWICYCSIKKKKSEREWYMIKKTQNLSSRITV